MLLGIDVDSPLVEMTPRPSIVDVIDRRFANVENLRQDCHRFSSRDTSPDFVDILPSELRSPTGFPMRMSHLQIAIPHVLLFRSDEEMFRRKTKRNIASVQDLQARREVEAEPEMSRQSVNTIADAIMTDSSVAVWMDESRPEPAAGYLVDSSVAQEILGKIRYTLKICFTSRRAKNVLREWRPNPRAWAPKRSTTMVAGAFNMSAVWDRLVGHRKYLSACRAGAVTSGARHSVFPNYTTKSSRA